MSSLKVLIAMFAVATFIVNAHSGGVPGGLGGEQVADEEVGRVIKQVRGEIDKRFERPIKSIEVISYKAQVVAGRNYFIKAIFHLMNGPDVVVHMRIYKSFRGVAELASIKTDVKRQDPIEYF